MTPARSTLGAIPAKTWMAAEPAQNQVVTVITKWEFALKAAVCIAGAVLEAGMRMFCEAEGRGKTAADGELPLLPPLPPLRICDVYLLDGSLLLSRLSRRRYLWRRSQPDQ